VINKKLRNFGNFVGKIQIVCQNLWCKLIFCYFLLYGNAYAADIKEILEKTRKLLTFGVNVLGPAIGAALILSGGLKLRRKDEDPRAASQAVWYIVAGVVVAIASFVLLLLMQYYHGGGSGDPEEIGNPLYD